MPPIPEFLNIFTNKGHIKIVGSFNTYKITGAKSAIKVPKINL